MKLSSLSLAVLYTSYIFQLTARAIIIMKSQFLQQLFIAEQLIDIEVAWV